MIRLKLFAFDDESIDPFEDGLLRIHKYAGTRIAVVEALQRDKAPDPKCDILVECEYAAPTKLPPSASGEFGREAIVDRVLEKTQECLEQGGYDIILLDNTLNHPATGEHSDYGVEVLLPRARAGSPGALIAIITGYPMIMSNRTNGLYRAFVGNTRADLWLTKVSEPLCDTLYSIILLVARGKADRERRLALEPLDRQNREKLANSTVPYGTVFTSPAMANTITEAIKGAKIPNIHIFLLGPTGVGKKHLLEVIKANDPRGPNAPWVLVNCGSIPKDSNSQIAYLFGYKKGDYTGADRDNQGALRKANRGNLILDEVHALSRDAQAALLHAIDQGDARDFAGRDYRVSVRVIAASNKDRHELEDFLERDFLNRLWVWPVEIPSLNDRRDDICPLALEFARQAGTDNGMEIGIALDALDLLKSYDWSKGEVRQLRNTVMNGAIRAVSDGARQMQKEHIQEAIKALSRAVDEDESVYMDIPVPDRCSAVLDPGKEGKARYYLDLCQKIARDKGRITHRLLAEVLPTRHGGQGERANVSQRISHVRKEICALLDKYPERWPDARKYFVVHWKELT